MNYDIEDNYNDNKTNKNFKNINEFKIYNNIKNNNLILWIYLKNINLFYYLI